MTNTKRRMTMSDALGRTQAEASLADVVNDDIAIASFTTEDRTIEGKQTKIAYITLDEPIATTHDRKPVEAKTLYTWSQIAIKQLEQVQEKLAEGNVITAHVTEHKGAEGNYQSLE